MVIIGLVRGRFSLIAFLLTVLGPTHLRERTSLLKVDGGQETIDFMDIGLILNHCTPTRKL